MSDWVWPMPIAANGKKPRISDGFHKAGDKRFRDGKGHRGQDIMYRKLLPTKPVHPWSSRWHEVYPNTPALAASGGTVTDVSKFPTGWQVIMQHADGIETKYVHLSKATCSLGQYVSAGHAIGIVGGSPTGYGLVHLHFDFLIHGKYTDAAKLMRTWRYVKLEEVL